MNKITPAMAKKKQKMGGAVADWVGKHKGGKDGKNR